MSKSRSFRYRLDKMSVYLPAVAMAVLALITFWLARNAPSFVPEEPSSLAATDPGSLMQDFSVRNYARNGRLTTELYGESGRHFPVRDIWEIDAIRVRAIAENGRVTTATAKLGTSNGAGTEMSLQGNAVVVQEALGQAPRLEFHGEELKLWPDQERVQSELPVTLIRGADRMTGDSLDYDKNTQLVEIKGRVRSTLLPATATKNSAGS